MLGFLWVSTRIRRWVVEADNLNGQLTFILDDITIHLLMRNDIHEHGGSEDGNCRFSRLGQIQVMSTSTSDSPGTREARRPRSQAAHSSKRRKALPLCMLNADHAKLTGDVDP